mmetsp:Transcript_9255/g.23032  ORF Transcript_9255/g.23032 Transcript_9255/m.23032 type:complete len:83 (+) Transcript_9255:212-460(+)
MLEYEYTKQRRFLNDVHNSIEEEISRLIVQSEGQQDSSSNLRPRDSVALVLHLAAEPAGAEAGQGVCIIRFFGSNTKRLYRR